MEQSFNWILSCIQSSSNEFQFKCCDNLIELFNAKYEGEEWLHNSTTELTDNLYQQRLKFSVEV